MRRRVLSIGILRALHSTLNQAVNERCMPVARKKLGVPCGSEPRRCVVALAKIGSKNLEMLDGERCPKSCANAAMPCREITRRGNICKRLGYGARPFYAAVSSSEAARFGQHVNEHFGRLSAPCHAAAADRGAVWRACVMPAAEEIISALARRGLAAALCLSYRPRKFEAAVSAVSAATAAAVYHGEEASAALENRPPSACVSAARESAEHSGRYVRCDDDRDNSGSKSSEATAIMKPKRARSGGGAGETSR